MKIREVEKIIQNLWNKSELHQDLEKKKFETFNKWLRVIWNDIMTQEERDLWKQFPNDFEVDSYMNLIESDLLVEFENPNLIDPVHSILHDNTNNSCLLYQLHSMTGYHWIIEVMSAVNSYKDLFTEYQFYIPNVIGWRVNKGTGVNELRYNDKGEELKLSFPRIGITPSKSFITDNTLISSSWGKEDKEIILPDSETVQDYKKCLIEYINLYRSEILLLDELIQFLLSPGVGVGKINKFFPELL